MILGNQKNISHFERAYRQGKLSHAYIICGPKGSGKKTFANQIAESLLCTALAENPEGKPFAPCGKCSGCIKTLSGNHPDLIHVTHQKDTLISVKEVREQIVESMAVQPYYGPYKIYIMEDADLMNVNAQNALLKTIEEPPAYGLLFLLTANIDGLLDTVRSRCLKVDMDILPDEEIRTFLIGRYAADPQRAAAAARFARGNPGQAIALLEETGTAEVLRDTAELMKSLGSMRAFRINERAKEIEAGDVRMVLDAIRTWFRDVLLVKTADCKEDLYFTQEHITIKDQSEQMSFETLNAAFKDIDETEAELKANVKAEAAVEVLLLKIQNYMKPRQENDGF